MKWLLVFLAIAVGIRQAISELPGLIKEQLDEIGRQLSYMNSLEFWRYIMFRI